MSKLQVTPLEGAPFGAKITLPEGVTDPSLLNDEDFAALKAAVEKAEAELKTALEGSDIEAIKAKKAELEKAAQGIAVKAYEKIQKEQQAKQNNNQDNNSKDDDNTVNADFEDIN